MLACLECVVLLLSGRRGVGELTLLAFDEPIEFFEKHTRRLLQWTRR